MNRYLSEVVGDMWTGVVTYDPETGYYHVAVRDSRVTISNPHYRAYVTVSRQEALEVADAVSRLSKRDWWDARWDLPPRFHPVEWEVWCTDKWVYFWMPAGCSDEEVVVYMQEYPHHFRNFYIGSLRPVAP